MKKVGKLAPPRRLEPTKTTEEVLTDAESYEYNDYTYAGSWTTDGTNVAYTQGTSDPRDMMNDLARYLGALYRQDNGESVKSIEYNGTEYTWNEAIGLKGSNWANNGTTLVSVITADYQASPASSYQFKINGETVTITIA